MLRWDLHAEHATFFFCLVFSFYLHWWLRFACCACHVFLLFSFFCLLALVWDLLAEHASFFSFVSFCCWLSVMLETSMLSMPDLVLLVFSFDLRWCFRTPCWACQVFFCLFLACDAQDLHAMRARFCFAFLLAIILETCMLNHAQHAEAK